MNNNSELNQITEQRFHETMTTGAETARNTVREYLSRAERLNDVIMPTGEIEFEADYLNKKIIIESNGLRLNEFSTKQAAARYGIPQRYIGDLMNGGEDWRLALAVQNLNEHNKHTNARFLIRSIDDTVGGFLSDRYRRLNSSVLVFEFLQKLNEIGAIVTRADITETKVFIEALLPQLFDINTELNGVQRSAFGVQFRTSDFGDGALELRGFSMQAVCTNGMIGTSHIKTVHLGARLPDNLQLSERTYKFDTKTQASAIHDITGNILSPDFIENEIQTIRTAAATPVNIANEIKRLPALGVDKTTISEVEKALMENRIDDGLFGSATKWKMAQSLTAVAREKNAETRRDLETLARKYINK